MDIRNRHGAPNLGLLKGPVVMTQSAAAGVRFPPVASVRMNTPT